MDIGSSISRASPDGRVRSFKILLSGVKSVQFSLELKFQSESRL